MPRRRSASSLHGTVRVLNRDDPRVAAMTGRKATVVTFGSDSPTQPDDYGLVRDGGMTWLAWAEDTSLPTPRRKAAADSRAFCRNPCAPPDARDATAHSRPHNALNVLAALALARAIGLATGADAARAA